MDARLKVEQAGARLGSLRLTHNATPEQLLAAERDLAEAQFEWAVEKAMMKHTPSKDLAERLCKRLMAVA